MWALWCPPTMVLLAYVLFKYYRRRAARPIEATLFDRLGGVYPIAALVQELGKRMIRNPVLGVESPNPHLRLWALAQAQRRAGMNWMRTLWLCDKSGGPFRYPQFNLATAHCPLQLSAPDFELFMNELRSSLDECGINNPERQEVLILFLKEKEHVLQCPRHQ